MADMEKLKVWRLLVADMRAMSHYPLTEELLLTFSTEQLQEVHRMLTDAAAGVRRFG